MKSIVIAGGSGFLGKVLESYFTSKGYLVKILTRNPKRNNDIYWDAKNLGNWTSELENLDVLINLTGKSVNCKYNEKNKKLIYTSRIDSTTILGIAVSQCRNPPKVWLNSSTATIYRHSIDKEMDEIHGEIGNDFSMNIAKSWEKAFYSFTNLNTRKIALRSSIVLGKKGGAFIPLKNLTKLCLGGKQGKGNQKVSWIHELDFARAIEFLIDNENLSGNINLCVPKPTDNKTLMKAFRKAIGIPFGFSQPERLLNFGAKLIGTETELILKSRNVIPKKLLDHGFKFIFTDIDIAVKDLLKTNS